MLFGLDVVVCVERKKTDTSFHLEVDFEHH